MTDKYLWDTYRTQFKVEVYEDGVAYIQTRIKPRDGTTFDVYQYSNTHLAACLPVRLACKLLDTHSTAFRVHQSAEDCTVLLFAESRLEEVADVRSWPQPVPDFVSSPAQKAHNRPRIQLSTLRP